MATIYIDNQPYEVKDGQNLLQACLVLGLRPALFLLAPGAALGRRVPPVRGQAVQGRERHAGQDRHGLHDAGRGRHAHLHRRPGGARVPRQRHRVADGQPPARLPGLRRGRRVPPPGHDRDDRPRLPPLPVPQAHLPQPGPRAVRQPRDEPLHPVLPLRAVLPRLRRRTRLRRASAAHDHVYFGRARGRRRWRASSAATWWRSARPASSPTRRSSEHYTRKWDLQTAPSICVHCGAGLQHDPRRALRRRCGASATATTARSTAISCATAAGTATSSSTASGASGRPLLAPTRRRGAAVAARTRRSSSAAVAAARPRRASSASARRARRWKPTSPCARWSGAERFYPGVSAEASAGSLDDARHPARGPGALALAAGGRRGATRCWSWART